MRKLLGLACALWILVLWYWQGRSGLPEEKSVVQAPLREAESEGKQFFRSESKKKVRPLYPSPPLLEDADSQWSEHLVWTHKHTGSELPEMGSLCAARDTLSFRMPKQCTGLKREEAREQSRCDAAACFPNLFLIGASKSGTTTLFEALVAHPRIVEMLALPNTAGESHIFTEPPPRNAQLNATTYYALRALKRAAPIDQSEVHKLNGNYFNHSQLYVLEYTPHYLVIPEARQRICTTATALLQEAHFCRYTKFIIMLRDPTVRAFSQWVMKTHMRVAFYNDQRDFSLATDQGRNRTLRYAQCWDRMLGPSFDLYHDAIRIHRIAAGPCHPRRYEPNLFQAYVLKSAYYYQLLPWLAGLAKPLNQHAAILVLEQFTSFTLSQVITSFLHIPLIHASQGYTGYAELNELVHTRRNPARDATASIPNDLRRSLSDFFRPFNKKLDTLVAPLLLSSDPTTGYPT